jgi:asparagine synthase (glutamine-hydrolysing)
MCGIFIAFSKKETSLDLNKCRLCLEEMSHRGPDFMFDSLQFSDRLYMGQTILSITGSPDKELKKYQVSENNRFNLVLNGEIYNFKKLARKHLENNNLATKTDSEILVNLYEKLSPKKIASELDGMYAYCVYDRKRKSLYLSRDLIGEKVLYRYEDDNHILFASETSTIINFLGGIKPNIETIHKYFYSRHHLANQLTEFENITVFPSGRTVEISLDHFSENNIYKKTLQNLISKEQYYRLSMMSEEEVIDEFDSICKKSAKKLATKTKYASVFSGGIDSSLASWYMFQQEDKPSLFIGLVFGEKDQVSNKLNFFETKLKHNILSIDINQDLYQKTMKKFYSEYKIIMPTHSFVSQMILSEVIRNNNCKVLIGGDGADELFGGYEFYKKFSSLSKNSKENISPYSGYVESEINFKDFNKELYRELKQKEWDEAMNLFSHMQTKEEQIQQTALYLDSLIQMETVGLRSSDLMSMTNSVESRSFFVTKEMLEFSINLPMKYKINFDEENPLLITKPLLKKAFIKIFGEDLLFAKQGYSGYPNESAEKILNGKCFNFINKLKPLNNFKSKKNQSLEWKIMNVEMFLRSVDFGKPE